MIRVLAPAGPARCLLWATRLVSHWWTMTSLVSHWWTMTSTHKAWRAGHAIKVDVGGAGFQIERDKMAESRPKPVTFDRALQREQARQKRHRQGGKQQELSHRLDQQAEIPAVPAKRKKTPAKETFLKDSAVLHTLGPARPALPSKEVASMLSSLRPPPSPYGTPPDLPSTLEELLEQVPECAEGPPLEEVQEEKKKNPFAWNLPPTPSNWHDTPPKKGVPYMPCYLDAIPSTSMTTTLTRQVLHRTSVPFTSCLYPTTSPNKVGRMSNVPSNPVRSSWTKRRHPPSWINCDDRSIPN